MSFIENINDNINAKKKLNDNDEKIVKESATETETKDKKENVINENDQEGEEKDKIIVEEKKEPEEENNEEIKEKPKNKCAEMYSKDSLNKARELFKDVKKFGKFTKNNNNIKITTADQVSTALNAISSIGKAAGYQNGNREVFLGTVAKYLEIDKIGDLQSGVYNGNNKLDGKFVDNPAAEFLMHLRNLIAYGLDYGTGNAMPDISNNKLDDTKQQIFKKLALNIDNKPKGKYLKGQALYDAITEIIGKGNITNVKFKPKQEEAKEMLRKIESIVETKTNEPSLLEADEAWYSKLMIPLVNNLYNEDKFKDNDVQKIIAFTTNNNDNIGKLLYAIDKIIKAVFGINGTNNKWKSQPLNSKS